MPVCIQIADRNNWKREELAHRWRVLSEDLAAWPRGLRQSTVVVEALENILHTVADGWETERGRLGILYRKEAG